MRLPLAAALASSCELRVQIPRVSRVLVAVGSHTDRATTQLAQLGVHARELPSVDLLIAGGETARSSIAEVTDLVREDIARHGTGVISTPRRREARHGDIADGSVVMDALTAVVGELRDQVDLVVTKGGITSADVATRSLGGRGAFVHGQVATGIPLWHVENDHGGTVQVVVPGNVGGDTVLRDIVVDAVGPLK